MDFEIYDEKKPGLWHRFSAERDRYLHHLRMVSYDFVRRGDCVILGRGGQLLFKDIPGVLRVRVVAPLQDRVEAVRVKFGYDERRASRAVQHEDNERAGFHRFLFHADWESLDLYDLIISTHFLSASAAADIIRNALGATEAAAVKKERARKLEDLYLAECVVVDLLYEQQLPIHFLEVEAVDGVITLKGTAGNRDTITRCDAVAAKVTGITRVINKISYVPEYVGV
jgi:cytidylate kinase